MSVRNYPGRASNGAPTVLTSASGASIGDKLTYVCPAGAQAVVRFASAMPTAGAATIQFRAIQGGQATVLQASTAAMQFLGVCYLNAGDSFRIKVSVLDAASTFDANIEAEEYPST